ncbi:MAG: site-2 protease family protein [Candidatus Pacebacteria bacterium]|nr:site-2 protease family protein [Candidatus Paceibacterota bacterium]MCF7862480.1 site-2 protease family protein [Candidatus Paceibacterota bacterium]
METVFFIAILIMSVVIHEVAHGFVAEYYGDNTARKAGRLTLNPIKHLDMFGSILLPLMLVLFKSPFLIGWAKPVPVNPYNLIDRKWGSFWVSFAGVLCNFFLAIFFGLILRFVMGAGYFTEAYFIVSSIVLVNLGLGLFNLIPVPPLDGSKILFALLPESATPFIEFMEKYSIALLLFFLFFLLDYLFPVMKFLYFVITGMNFS